MEVVNDYVGSVFLTLHAQERWAERGSPGDIRQALKAACPFGGQYGDNMLLAHEDVVFVTKRNKSGLRLAVTVLTRDMAAANIEMALPVTMAEGCKASPVPAVSGCQPAPFVGGLVGVAEVQPFTKSNWAKPKQTTQPQPPQPPRKSISFADLTKIYNATEEELAWMGRSAVGLTHIVIQRELAQRRRIAKQAEHARRMEYHRQAVKNALLRLIPAAEHAQAFAAIEAEERAMGLRTDGGEQS